MANKDTIVADLVFNTLTQEQFDNADTAGSLNAYELYATPDNSLKTNQITNCLTEIPQDIKLELNNGTLTLKAGSKIHLAYGDLETTATTTSNISATQTSDGKYMVIRTSTSALYMANIDMCLSGTIVNRPTLLERGAGLYFATDENKMYLTGDKGATWYSGEAYSLPLGIVTVSNGAISSIDQIFNGFGYIGSTVFALPGVKGLVPNGRNEDGTLKNTEITVSNVLVSANQSYTIPHVLWAITSDEIQLWDVNYYKYDEKENKSYELYNGSQLTTVPAMFGSLTSGVISNFEQKTAFHAVDYSELNPKIVDDKISTILNAIYPAGSLYLTSYNTAACPIAAAIPGSTWELIGSGRALWTGNGSNGGSTIAAGLPNITGSISTYIRSNSNTKSGAFSNNTYANSSAWGGGSASSFIDLKFDASKSNSIYGSSTTVQPPAFVVNVWRRVS